MSKPLKETKLTFEDAMQRLEQAVEQMEARDLPLDQIIEKYEEGVKLVEFCENKLTAAEKKIELLTHSRSGEVKVSSLEKNASLEDEKDETSLL
ncbi:MAG: exodeoxyribonuclease VII small subunit [bacterium]